jgi:hypothetical protein
VVSAILGSVDWIAWLALHGTGSDVRAAILGALTSLILALGRVCSRLLRPGRGDDG